MEPTDDIADIEDEIDALADSAERCRKIMVVAKLAVAAGALAVAVCLLGVVRADAVTLLLGASAILGGVAVFGSHRSTLHDLRARIAARETHRNALIDAMDLPVTEGA
jgi:hypothetical protein